MKIHYLCIDYLGNIRNTVQMNTKMESHVYFAPHKSENRFKIGKADDLVKRLGDLCAGNLFDLDLDRTFAIRTNTSHDAHQIEAMFHIALKKYRIASELCGVDGFTEWFSLDGYPKALELARFTHDSASFVLSEMWGKDLKSKLVAGPPDRSIRANLIELLEKYRLSLNLTQADMARRLNTPLPTYRDFIKNSAARDRLSEVKILQFLGLESHVNQLISDVSDSIGFVGSTRKRARK